MRYIEYLIRAVFRRRWQSMLSYDAMEVVHDAQERRDILMSGLEARNVEMGRLVLHDPNNPYLTTLV